MDDEEAMLSVEVVEAVEGKTTARVVSPKKRRCKKWSLHRAGNGVRKGFWRKIQVHGRILGTSVDGAR